MKKHEVVIGGRYLAKVSGRVVPVRITGQSPYGGWDAVNTETNRAVRIKSPQRLRRPAEALARERIAGEENVVSKARKVVLGNVYSVASGGTYLPVRADRELGHGRYEGTALYPGGKTETIRFSTDRVRGDGQPEDQWRKRQEAGKQERESQATQAATANHVIPPAAENATTAGELKPRKKAGRANGALSGLDAAAKVLAEAGQPLNCRTIVERATERGYWKTGGKTPAATVYAAIIREISAKGDASRFRKTDRGMFTLRA